MFEKVKREIKKLKKELNLNSKSAIDIALNVLFTLNHLREWICPQNKELIEDQKNNTLKNRNQYNLEELLFLDIYEKCPEYKIIQILCNRSKHGNIRNNNIKTNFFSGCYAGFSCAGDSLNRLNLVVGSKDLLREIIEPVYKFYCENYFDKELK